MRSILTATVLAILLVVAAITHAHASECKGLDQAACGTHAACKWWPERVAGQTLTKAGTPAKRSMKAHCHIVARSKTAAASATPAPAGTAPAQR